MHLVVGVISARYTGRGDTTLDPYLRIVLQKEDGSVSVHSERGVKPLNYMGSSKERRESFNDKGERIWTFVGKGEILEVTFHSIVNEIHLDLGRDDPGHSRRDGTEVQLQEWLSRNLCHIENDLEFTHREYQTGNGPVDLLARQSSGAMVAIEVKRIAHMTTVSQVGRYLDALSEKHPDQVIVGAIAAVSFKAKTLELAEKKNIRCIQVPPDWHEGGLEVDKPGTAMEVAAMMIAHDPEIGPSSTGGLPSSQS